MSMENQLKSQVGNSVILYLKGGQEIQDVKIVKMTNGIDPIIECDVCFGRLAVFRINELAGFMEYNKRKGENSGKSKVP